MDWWLVSLLSALVLCPLLPGLVNRVKAFFAGRSGPSLFQLYYDLFKLLKKGRVYSLTSCGLVGLSPWFSLGCVVVALLFMPLGMCDSPLRFTGDVILFLYLLVLSRLLMVLGALDAGTSFEGMGSSRKVHFSALSELVLLGAVVFLICLTGRMDLSGLLNSAGVASWGRYGVLLLLTSLGLYIVMLSECCRGPFGDPDTQLELAMIDEAMVLDYSGSDLAAIRYAASLKMWVFGSLFVMVLLPADLLDGFQGWLAYSSSIFATALSIGVIESVMARYRFKKIPQVLLAGFGLTLISLVFLLFFGGR